MQRLALLASLLLTAPALAQQPAKPPATAPATPPAAEAEKKPVDAKEAPVKKDGETPPALPGDVEKEKTDAAGAGAASAPAAEPDATAAGLAAMRAQLKEEITAELRDQIQAEIETAARDATNQRAAQLEWEEERWVEEVKPRLNFLEFDGYFRTRFDFFSNLHLGTFDPLATRGTSAIAPPTMYRPYDGDAGCVDGNFNGTGYQCVEDGNPGDTSGLTSMNMRLRLDPTLNVSEDIRIRSTMDIFDNLVLGSTPESRPGFANNPTLPLPLFAASQLPPEGGFNTPYDAIRIKRLWAEIMTPFGQLRLGRQPQNWGLGVLVNDGNGIDGDYGDQADQILFATRAFGHYIVPGYSISSSGAFGRGGGSGNGGDGGLGFYQGELGQRFNLDPSDDVHTFILTIAKKDKPEDIEARLREGDWVLNYGVFGVYRTQQFDTPSYYSELFPSEPAAQANIDNYVRRNATAGVASLWAQFRWDKLRIETEAVGLIANIEGTSTSSNGLEAVDDALQILDGDGNLVNQPIFVLQGGLAFESEYSMFNDSLSIGLDFGLASGDDAPGMGLRPVIKQEPEPGDFDGKQYGECLERDGAGNCLTVDNTITNFKFDPGYNVDLILFREVIGTVTDALYIKPHITYRVTEDLGIRGDFMWANALVQASTPGLQFPLGIELDGTAWYRSDDGFFLMFQGGVLIPLGGLGHARVDPDDPNSDLRTFRDGTQVDARFATPATAWTLQAFAGVEF